MTFWRRRREADLHDEIRSHLEMSVQDRVERGETRSSAIDAARREFGNEGLVKDATRDAWGGNWGEVLLQDLRYGARMLARSSGFAIVAVFTLSLGIGLNTALFSVVNGVLLSPLSFPKPDQLVSLYQSRNDFDKSSITYPNFLDWQRENHSFTDIAGHRLTNFSLTGSGEAERVKAVMISSGFFAVLGVKPLAGRFFVPDEDRLGAQPVVLISEGFWHRQLGSAPSVIGRTLILDGTAHTIVGIIPSSFHLQIFNFVVADVYTPIGQWNYDLFRNRATAQGMDAIGRLKPGVTLQQARADMQGITSQLALAYPQADKDVGASIIPLKQSEVERIQPLLLLLLGAVGFVLLIACANVANLVLARSTSRTREFAIRAALGASRTRVIRQLLTESLLLAFAGGSMGVLLASWGVQGALSLAGSLNPSGIPRADEIRLNTHVLIFSLGITFLVGIVFGLIPALKTADQKLRDSLQEGGRNTTARSGGLRALVVAEVAMSLVLLVGAGLMIRSFVYLWSVNPGFVPEHAATFYVSLAPPLQKANPETIRSEFRHVADTIGSVPGVESVSLMDGSLPMQGDSEDPFWIEGRPKPVTDTDKPWALWYEVDSNYLRAMGIPLLRGRFFTPADDSYSRGVAVVDTVFAEKYFPNKDPIGKTIVDDYVGPTEIIGVVGHVQHWGPGLDTKSKLRAQMYFPFAHIRDKAMPAIARGFGVVVRSRGDPAGVIGSIRAALAHMNSEQVMHDAHTMRETISDTLAPQQFMMILLGVFAALALVLASIGIYGVVSYLSAQRTHEIGLRVVLGAQRWHVLRLVLSEGVRMATLGVAIGVAAAFGLTHLLANFLYGVSTRDPLTIAGVALLLAIVTLTSCYIPARRAMRVDPLVALRYE